MFVSLNVIQSHYIPLFNFLTLYSMVATQIENASTGPAIRKDMARKAAKPSKTDTWCIVALFVLKGGLERVREIHTDRLGVVWFPSATENVSKSTKRISPQS